MAVIQRVHVPLQKPENIIPHLGAPHHWREGRSAKCLIDQWWHANDFPPSIKSILEQAPEWRDAELSMHLPNDARTWAMADLPILKATCWRWSDLNLESAF